MPNWSAEPEPPSPPGTKAADLVPKLMTMVDPIWFIALSDEDQRTVFRSLCKDNRWYWPPVAKLMRRSRDPNGINRLTKSQRQQQARIAAHSSWARTVNPTRRTAPARAALMKGFEHRVDPEGALTPRERARRAESAKRKYFSQLALASSKKRAKKRR